MKLFFTSTIIKPTIPFASTTKPPTQTHSIPAPPIVNTPLMPKAATPLVPSQLGPQTLDTYSKYIDKNTFRNTTSYFSGTTMFSRVDSGVHGCSSCGAGKPAVLQGALRPSPATPSL